MWKQLSLGHKIVLATTLIFVYPVFWLLGSSPDHFTSPYPRCSACRRHRLLCWESFPYGLEEEKELGQFVCSDCHMTITTFSSAIFVVE